MARLWADGWVPVKVINPSSVPIILRRNVKLADIYTCLALEDFDDACECVTNGGLSCPIRQHTNNVEFLDNSSAGSLSDIGVYRRDCEFHDRLTNLGRADIDLSSCQLSTEWKEKLDLF